MLGLGDKLDRASTGHLVGEFTVCMRDADLNGPGLVLHHQCHLAVDCRSVLAICLI